MNYRKKILTASITACLCVAAAAHAEDQATQKTAPNSVQTPDAGSAPGKQTAPAPADQQGGGANQTPTELGTIEVVGIRESLKKSIDTKRIADSHVEVITAPDSMWIMADRAMAATALMNPDPV